MDLDIKNFVRLTNIDTTNALRHDWEERLENLLPKRPYIRVIHLFDFDQIFNTSWIDLLNSKGVNPPSCLVFSRDSDYQHFEAHIDVDETFNIGRVVNYSFNLITDPETDSFMTWYKPLTKGRYTESPVSGKTIGYYTWPIEDCEEIISAPVNQGKLWMVNTGNPYPHSVRMGSRKRTCFAFKCMDSSNTWDQAVELYKDILEK